MKACDCSARSVRKAEGELSLRQGNLPPLAKALGVTTVLVVGGIVVGLWNQPPLQSGELAIPPSAAEAAQEAAIYSAMDLADPSQAGQVSEHLSSPSEALRLAALRYLAKVDPEPYAGQLTALLSDESSRVRLATVQLLANVHPNDPAIAEQISERLLKTLLEDDKDLGERMLAATSLRSHKPREAARLTRVLDHPQLAGRVSDLLAHWTNVSIQPAKGESLRAAWERRLAAGS